MRTANGAPASEDEWSFSDSDSGLDDQAEDGVGTAEEEDYEHKPDEEQAVAMSARDRKALLTMDVLIPNDAITWHVNLHLEHGFTQVEICKVHKVAPSTLLR